MQKSNIIFEFENLADNNQMEMRMVLSLFLNVIIVAYFAHHRLKDVE